MLDAVLDGVALLVLEAPDDLGPDRRADHQPSGIS